MNATASSRRSLCTTAGGGGDPTCDLPNGAEELTATARTRAASFEPIDQCVHRMQAGTCRVSKKVSGEANAPAKPSRGQAEPSGAPA